MTLKKGDTVLRSINAHSFRGAYPGQTYEVAQDEVPGNQDIRLVGLDGTYDSRKFTLVSGAPQVAAKPDLHVPGAKDDGAKPRIDLILVDMPRALLEVAKVATFGANKYSDGGWLRVPHGEKRYRAAMQRHDLSENIDGGGLDPETKFLHAAHVAWNALARLELILRERASQPAPIPSNVTTHF